MKGVKGGFEAQLLFLCDGDCDGHWVLGCPIGSDNPM